MKPCSCGATPVLNSVEAATWTLWCPDCRKTLTREYITRDLAVVAWVHGEGQLPAPCPFCEVSDVWPPKVREAESPIPMIRCNWPDCPIKEVELPLDQWNRARPRALVFEELYKRWNSRKDRYTFRTFLVALRRSIAQHKHGGRYEHPRFRG